MWVLDASLSSSLSITTTISRQGALAPIRSVYAEDTTAVLVIFNGPVRAQSV